MGVGLPYTQWLLKAGLPKAPEPMRETAISKKDVYFMLPVQFQVTLNQDNFLY